MLQGLVQRTSGRLRDHAHDRSSAENYWDFIELQWEGFVTRHW